MFETDRHAKMLLKAHVRNIRTIERSIEVRDGTETQVVCGYCSSVRSVLDDDGRTRHWILQDCI